MNDPAIVAIVGVVGLCGMETFALSQGINGKVLTTVVGAVCVLVGFCFGQTI